ncbi:MAG TPA: hypothetical protein VHV55_14030 [Pirellulales bacterium]|jgi:hypothetical protein|nr:hypothetical protein [Pirellulales bacterium]
MPMLVLGGLAGCWGVLGGSGLVAETSQAAEPQAGGGSRLPRQILIIRHAEKTGNRDDVHLSSEGQARADRLPELFVASAERKIPFARPDFLFAAGNKESSSRPVETISPLAAKLRLPINSQYHDSAVKELAHELRHNPIYAGKIVLVCWRHDMIPALAQALQARNAPQTWPGHVCDRVWLISYNAAGTASIYDLPQRLLPGDSQ